MCSIYPAFVSRQPCDDFSDEGIGNFKIACAGEDFSLAAMKRYAPFALLASLILVVIAPFAFAATVGTPNSSRDRSPAAPIASAISTVTGIAISPLLGTSAYGAYKWWTAKDDVARAALPWYAQAKFWVPALLLVVICAAKDAFGTMVPTSLKKPLDVLETIENKFSGLVAAGAVIPFAIDAITKMFLESSGGSALVAPSFVHSGVAAIHLAAFDVRWLLNLLTVPFGVAVFLVVWLASHAINVLILLSPWGAIDAVLKAARTALLGLVTIAATVNPWAGAALSIGVIVFAYLIAGWAFRLTIFGSVFSWEFVTRRCSRFKPAANGNRMFAGAAFTSVPVRTYGRLSKRADGGLDFVYKPWLVLAPRTAPVPVEPRALAVGEGVFFSDLVDEADRTLFSLPPRYRGHEEAVASAYGLEGVRPAGLHKAWSELREMLGGRAVKKAPLAA
jgi:hypothetical protein